MNSTLTPSLAITWEKPTFLLPLFCLCPLLAASNSLALAIALSLLVLVATAVTLLVIQWLRRFTPASLHVFTAFTVSSTVITLLELALHAWFYNLYRTLGLFLPLMVIAALLFCRTELLNDGSFTNALRRWAKMNAGFSFAALILGAGREVIGHGSLLHDAASLLGTTPNLHLTLFHEDMGFLMAVLAPGGFIGFGIGVALYNWAWFHLARKTEHAQR